MFFLISSCGQGSLLKVSLPAELIGSWAILSHIPIQGKWQDGLETDGSAKAEKYIHQLEVGQYRIQEIHYQPRFQGRAVSNVGYRIVEASEDNGLWRLEIEQLLPDANINGDLSEKYIQQTIEVYLDGDESEWHFYYDTWEWQTYYCVKGAALQKYAQFDWSKDPKTLMLTEDDEIE